MMAVKREGQTADLTLVATAEAFRGRGVLTLMAGAALRRLRDERIAVCTVATQLSNRAALRAYQSIGFAFERTVVDLHLSRS